VTNKIAQSVRQGLIYLHSIVTSVDQPGSLTPSVFALYQNHPNPFNPTTEISFDLPAAYHVKLEIFNSIGQKVTNLVDRYLEAGEHTVIWNSTEAASGVYIYRLEAGDFVATRKMVLLK